MSPLIGFTGVTLSSFAILAILIAMGFRDGDRFGDALVRTRLLRAPSGEGWRLFAEVQIDNQNDSPVMVSARVAPASALTLFFGSDHARRTALAHRDRLADYELLGAVEGRATARFLVPADTAAGARALRLTAVVDQVGRRTRVVATTMLVSGALDGVLPAGRGVTAGR